MTTSKNLGIWMDHESAHLMEYKSDPIDTKTIDTKFTHAVKEDTLKKSEILMHNKEQHEQSEYYKDLGNIIKNYDDVLLFGPTNAKVELYNLLKSDHHFAKINIEVEHADKMTVNQQHAFVKKHFLKEKLN